jgi:hypothetical protein
MRSHILKTLDWIKDDYSTHPFRFIVEVIAWVFSITCSIILAVTIREPAFYILYPLWISGCIMYAWAAFTRQSFGMLANYFLLASIDLIGFVRYLT